MSKKKVSNPNAGITFNKANQKYYARFYRDGKEHYVGTYCTVEEARNAREKALAKMETTGFVSGYTRNRSGKGGTGEADPWKVIMDPDPSSFSNPEHVIRFKVLLGAIEDLEQPESRNIYRGAIEWFNGERKYPKGYSFDEICGIFRLDTAAVKEALNKKLRNNELK